MALLKLFPGAVYSHGAQSFLIEDLDAKARIAWAVTDVGEAYPSCARSILTEIYLYDPPALATKY